MSLVSVGKRVQSLFEQICRSLPTELPHFFPAITSQIPDASPQVLRAAMGAICGLVGPVLRHISQRQDQALWTAFEKTRSHMLHLVANKNDAVRNLAIRFMEIFVLTTTEPKEWSKIEPGFDHGFTVKNLPQGQQLPNKTTLMQNGSQTLTTLRSYLHSGRASETMLSATNLSLVVTAIKHIATLRSQNFDLIMDDLLRLANKLARPGSTALNATQVKMVAHSVRSALMDIHTAQEAVPHLQGIMTSLQNMGFVYDMTEVRRFGRKHLAAQGGRQGKRQRVAPQAASRLQPELDLNDSKSRFILQQLFALNSEQLAALVVKSLDNFPGPPICRTGTRHGHDVCGLFPLVWSGENLSWCCRTAGPKATEVHGGGDQRKEIQSKGDDKRASYSRASAN